MKVVGISFLMLVATILHLAVSEQRQRNDITDIQVKLKASESSDRSKRQMETTTTTTTTRPKKKNRPTNLFSLISLLISETREDTNRAFNEIGTLFNSQFSDSNTTTAATTSTTSKEPTSTSSNDSDEDNEITTTTESFRITREEFLGILRSNVQGLRQLFGKEFQVAIRDSNQNVREFGRDLGLALRPYFV